MAKFSRSRDGCVSANRIPHGLRDRGTLTIVRVGFTASGSTSAFDDRAGDRRLPSAAVALKAPVKGSPEGG